jgi:hypothetical protein
MPTITRRPTSTIQVGAWSLTPSSGSTAHAILSDNVDTTYLSTTAKILLDNRVLNVDIADLTTSDIPATAKIRQVSLKVRLLQLAPAAGSSFLSDVVRFFVQVSEIVDEAVPGDLGDNLAKLFRYLVTFPNPIPPGGGSATWQTVTVRSWTERPSGGEWTLAALNGATWKLGRLDLSGQLSKVSELYVDIEYNERPTVTVTPFAGDLVTDTTRPLIKIVYGDTEDDPQDALRMRVFTAAQVAAVGFNVDTTVPVAASPGVGGWMVGAGTQWQAPDLPNGDYTVYAQVRQQWLVSAEHASAWVSYAWTQDVPGPPTPTLTATPNGVTNWVRLDIVAGVVDPLTDPPTETYTVYASDNGGVTYDVVWGGWQVQADSAGLASVIDYQAPLNQARLYRVAAYTTLGTVKVASDFSDPPAMATPNQLEFQFKCPGAPSLNQTAGVMGDSPSWDGQQGVFDVLTADGDRAYKVVVNGSLAGIEGEMELLDYDPEGEQWRKFAALYEFGGEVLWQFPTGEQHWIMFGRPVSWEWRTDGGTGESFRVASVPYFEVDAPTDPGRPS